MTMEADLVDYVLRQAPVVALIGSRFEPLQNSQGATLPAVAYQVLSAPADYSHDGLGMMSWRVQLTISGSTYTSVVGVCDALRMALAGKGWAGPGGAYVSFVENILDGLAPTSGQAGFYIRRMDLLIEG